MIITGSQGFIGSYLVREFEAEPIDKKLGKDILDCDLPNTDVIIHLAAQTSVIDSIKDPQYDALNNIIGTIRLAKRYRNTRFIFASSGGAIQEKIESPYGLSKFCAEEYIKMLCNDYVILRFPNIYGQGSHSVVDKFINGDVEIYGDGSSTRDYVHVSDLIRAIKMSLHWPTGTYSLGSEKSVPVLDLAKATGKTIKFADRIEGELQYSQVPNNTSWKPKIDVINYIKENV